jgi:hypothetical protein
MYGCSKALNLPSAESSSARVIPPQYHRAISHKTRRTLARPPDRTISDYAAQNELGGTGPHGVRWLVQAEDRYEGFPAISLLF